MILSPYAELRAIKDKRGDNAFISIKEALKAIQTVKNKVSKRRNYYLDVEIDNMLRLSEIEQCNNILKELK